MEIVRNKTLKGFEWLLSQGYEMDVKNQKNLDILRTKSNCPVVVYFNHTATDDPLFIFQLVHATAPERLANVIVPVSESHAKFKKFPAYSVFVTVSRELWGFDTPKVVQSYRMRRDGAQDDALAEKASELGKSLFAMMDTKLPTSPLILLSPEGHRSETGQLLPAEGGAGVIARLMERKVKKGQIEEGYFLPVAIRVENFAGKKFYYNPVHKPRIECTIGEAIAASTAINFGRVATGDSKSDSRVVSHYLMSQVARLLPEEMQGVYRPDLIQDTFQGRFDQWSDPNGHVFVRDNWVETSKTDI